MSEEEGTCHKEVAQTGPSLLQNGDLVFQTHHVGWIIAAFFTLIAVVASFWLMNMHLKWYTNKREQRYIIRILFLVPIYAVISLASYLWWNHATPLILIRDCYEAIVLTAFFYLLLAYLSPDPDGQRLIFAKHGLSKRADREARAQGEDLKKWVFPLGFIKWKPSDGLVYLQCMKWGVLQYCVLRPLTTLSAVILDYLGLYCESSWGVGWGHIYITIIVSLSVTIAMYCLIQLYVSVSPLLSSQRPLLKLFSIKAVVFLTFWQATFLSGLAMFDVVKDTKYMTAEDINIGIGALLETFEMAIFAFLHIKAFTYKVYRPVYIEGVTTGDPPEPTPKLRSLGHALDFRETFREVWSGSIYMWAKMHGREPQDDVHVNRQGYYESVFGKPRGVERSALLPTQFDEKARTEDGPATFPSVRIDVEEHVDIEGERQWLGAHDDYGYGIQREKSDGLETQIHEELERRGYDSRSGQVRSLQPNEELGGHSRKRRSWWRNIYDHISQTGTESNVPEFSSRQGRMPGTVPEDDVQRSLLSHDDELDSPPPTSRFRHERSSASRHNHQPHHSHSEHRRPSGRPHHSHSRSRQMTTSPPPTSLLQTNTASFSHLFPAPPSSPSLHYSNTSSDQHGYQFVMAGERRTSAAKVARSQLTHDSHTSMPVEIVHPGSSASSTPLRQSPLPPRSREGGRSTPSLGLQLPLPSHNSPPRRHSPRHSVSNQPDYNPYDASSPTMYHYPSSRSPSRSPYSRHS